jgi:hypothetical protein
MLLIPAVTGIPDLDYPQATDWCTRLDDWISSHTVFVDGNSKTNRHLDRLDIAVFPRRFVLLF